MKHEAEFALLWEQARQAAHIAAEAENTRLGDENSRGLDCGFAWLEVRPGNSNFAKWLKAKGYGSKGHNGGIHVWYSKLVTINTQSISVFEAACRAARNHLVHGLDQLGEDGGRTLTVGSRYD